MYIINYYVYTILLCIYNTISACLYIYYICLLIHIVHACLYYIPYAIYYMLIYYTGSHSLSAHQITINFFLFFAIFGKGTL